MHAPATARNRDFILEVLEDVLPPSGTILEVASGTGEHAVYMAARLQDHAWQPTDVDDGRINSIEAWRTASDAPDNIDNILPALRLDACSPRWPVEENPPTEPVTAILAINLIHIAPWDVCLGLMAGAGRILAEGGVLYLYGPYKRDGVHTAPSNESFDENLRAQDPSWGVRNLDDVIGAAEKAGLVLLKVVEMPANNLSVVFKKPTEADA
jgi:hypothetical protein